MAKTEKIAPDKEDIIIMPNGRVVRAYIIAVIAVGGIASIGSAWTWSSAPLPFACYLALALFTSTLKVKLPGITGTFSANSVVTLMAISRLGLAEAISLSIACSLVQSLWRAARRPLLVQVLFNAAVFAISAAATFGAYHLLLGWTEPSARVIPFLAASCAAFLVNTATVSGVIALLEHKPVLQVWRVWQLWSFPYYLVSVAVAALLISTPPALTVKLAAAVIPLVCVAFFAYRLVVARAANRLVEEPAPAAP